MMNTTDWEIESLKTLLSLCEERGIKSPFTIEEMESHIQELTAEGATLLEQCRFLNRGHAILHRLLYPGIR